MTGVRGMKDGKQKDVEMRDVYILKKQGGKQTKRRINTENEDAHHGGGERWRGRKER